MINLIGLSGYAGSGKSETGRIIQYLTSESSKKRTYQEFVEKGQGNNDFQQWYNSEWEIKGFAQKLKQIASLLTGIPEYKFDDPEFKKGFLPTEWNIHHFVSKNGGSPVLPKYKGSIQERQMTVREFLQKLGTDAVRNVLGEDVWVNALFADYQLEKKKNGYQRVVKSVEGIPIDFEYEVEYPKWIITDCRFPNEAHAIKDRGGMIVRINREMWEEHTDIQGIITKIKVGSFDRHCSETALDNWNWDYIIDNDGNMEYLISVIREMLQRFEIITP